MQVYLGAGRSGEQLLADYRELDGLVLPSGAVGSGWAVKGMPLLPAGQRTWFSGGAGAGVPAINASIIDAAGPGYGMQLGPATLATKIAPQWLMSWWANPTLWPASYTRRLRVTCSAIVEVNLAPSAGEKPFIGMINLGGDLAAAGQSGIQLCFDTGVTNTWRVRSKLTPAGALVLGNDSTIGGLSRIQVGFRYVQSAAPTVEVLVNDAVLQTFTGVAALPVPAVLPAFPAAAVGGGFQATFGIAGAAGGNAGLVVRLGRYTVETIVP